MNPTECPRCAAERSAKSLRATYRLATWGSLAGVAALLVATRWLSGTATHGRFVTTERAQLGGVLALGLVLGAWALLLALRDLAAELELRAATPLPPPASDPLLHYRTAPTPECPRHPFAR